MSTMSLMEKVMAILRLEEGEQAAHTFPLSLSRHSFPTPHEWTIPRGVGAPVLAASTSEVLLGGKAEDELAHPD